jgi:quercetin dioxygenase-like cupin family protein
MDELNFSADKPAVLIVQKNENNLVISVGLLKDQVLLKHKTVYPALLIVMSGSVAFKMNGKETILRTMDTFNIPVDIEHEVVGMNETSIFLIIKTIQTEKQ